MSRINRRTAAGLSAALVTGAVLMAGGPPPGKDPAPPPGRPTADRVWPTAGTGRFPGLLAGGKAFQPVVFTDAGTVVGTTPGPDDDWVHLEVRRADGGTRVLRRFPAGRPAMVETAAVLGDDVVWTEAPDDRGTEIWTANLRSPAAARRLTTDTGNAVFYGTEDDLAVAEGRVHWAANPVGGTATEVRSVAMTGGPVRVRSERGLWAMARWPWLIRADDPAGATQLRNYRTGQDVRIPVRPDETVACSPVWCRVIAGGGADPGRARIEVMRPDGSERRVVASGGAQVALNDVAVLDRFEVLAEPMPGSDLTGVTGLLVHDLRAGRTVVLAPAVRSASYRNGVLWWSTGERDAPVWHSLDLRTIE